MRSIRLRHRTACTLTALASALVSVAMTSPAHAESADYNEGYTLGSQAYEYGLPLLDTERVYQTQTSVNVPDGAGDGPVNQFSNVPHLAIPKPNQQTVVAPNSDTLYSIAWLDLTRSAQVIHVPAISGRFYTLAMYTPWTENFYNVTSLPGSDRFGAYGTTRGGNFVVTPPGFRGSTPPGLRVIRAPYKRVWIIGRTLIRGTADTGAVNAIQRQYRITPLSHWGTRYVPATPAHRRTKLTFAKVPGTQPGQDPITFYQALNREMATFAPMAQDAPLLAQLRKIDVGVGLNPVTDHNLSPDMLRGMRDAITNGPANLANEVKQLYLSTSAQHGGYLTVRTGTYGTNYRLRAIIDHVGLGAPRSNIATYPIGQIDPLLQPLSGAQSYVLHIPAGQMPPVEAFWSLTMYNLQGFYTPNAINRYVVNDRSGLVRNADGSIDIYIQHNKPTNPAQVANWLPAPTGDFRLMWRLYGPGAALAGILSGNGWKPPTINRCVLGIGLPTGTMCAS